MQFPHSLVLSDEMSAGGGTNSDSSVGGGGIGGGAGKGGEGGWDATSEPQTEASPSPSSCGMAVNRVTTTSIGRLDGYPAGLQVAVVAEREGDGTACGVQAYLPYTIFFLFCTTHRQ